METRFDSQRHVIHHTNNMQLRWKAPLRSAESVFAEVASICL